MLRRLGGPGMHGAGGIALANCGMGQLAAAQVQQPFLLNWANYTGVNSAGALPWGREFSVGAAATCTGIRLIVPNIETVGIRLWRVADTTLLASRDGLAVAANTDTSLLFVAGVTLAAGTLYRCVVVISAGGANNRYYPGVADQPDGPITTLTGNTWVYALADVYPNLNIAGNAVAVEPIIWA